MNFEQKKMNYFVKLSMKKVAEAERSALLQDYNLYAFEEEGTAGHIYLQYIERKNTELNEYVEQLQKELAEMRSEFTLQQLSEMQKEYYSRIN